MFTTELNGIPVVTAPTEIDISNKDAMRQDLLAATAYSAVIVVNMSGTTFCDASGMRVLAEIGSMLAGVGGELRAVITRPFTLRCLAIARYDSLLRIFPTVPKALSPARQNWKTQPQAA